MPRRTVYGGKWPRVRLAVLERDGWLCTIRGPGCTVKATDVDHIIPVLQGGSWYDEDNLRAACRPCNLKRRGGRSSHQWRTGRTFITLVVGRDEAAISAYVRLHAQPGDLVVDHHSLVRDLGSPTAATTARNAMLNELRRGKVTALRAWVTSTNPDATTTLPHHRAVTPEGRPVVSSSSDASSLSPPPAGAPPSRQW